MVTDERIIDKQLLWVDDDIAHFGPFIEELKLTGFKVSTSSSTDDALKACRENTFDVILVDILMPPPDGIELLRRVRPIQPNASLAALSSFLYLARYRDEIK